MTDKRLERLKWAIRYIGHHPDLTPSLWMEEYGVDQDVAINFDSAITADVCLRNGLLNEDADVEEILGSFEASFFKKLVELS